MCADCLKRQRLMNETEETLRSTFESKTLNNNALQVKKGVGISPDIKNAFGLVSFVYVVYVLMLL
jgi:hypothetical protein